MNCRAEVLEVSVEGRQVEEAALAVLHTVLLHRSTGKFHYKKEGTYSIGTVGTQDVDCDFIDFAYVRVSSEELDRALRRAAQLGQRRDGADLAGVLPEEKIPLAFFGRVHPLGAVDHQGERGEPGQRAGAADLPREVRGGQRLRHQPEGRAALPLQDLLPDHGLLGHLGHHHHAAAHQRHAGSVGAAFGAAFPPPHVRAPPPERSLRLRGKASPSLSAS
uniref:Autophagy-related protein 101 n=1 Tax=Anas zonorhyncha TaxID=75864 RepID=A0A8B9UQU7_9AVES